MACDLHAQPCNRELSQGHFSDDNQKKLIGTETITPVYEAKMTGDTRLVVSQCRGFSHPCELTSLQYHIDCIPDGDVGFSANISGFILTSITRAKPKVIIFDDILVLLQLFP